MISEVFPNSIFFLVKTIHYGMSFGLSLTWSWTISCPFVSEYAGGHVKIRILSAFLCLSVVACGTDSAQQAQVSSERFSIGVLGIEMGACTRDELSRFIAGERVPAISGKLPLDQQKELRTKFSRVLKFDPNRVDEALASPYGAELFKLLSVIFPSDFDKDYVRQTLQKSVDDGQFTLLEFVSNYPTENLRVNGLSFITKKDSLERLLLTMEKEYSAAAE